MICFSSASEAWLYKSVFIRKQATETCHSDRRVEQHAARQSRQGCTGLAGQVGQTGGRFSRKAARPSAASAVEAVTVRRGWSTARASAAAMSHVA